MRPRLRMLGVTAAVALGIPALAASGAAAATDFTWSGGGASGSPGWSDTNNWSGGAAPHGTIGTLSFPALSSGACTASTPTDTCYASANDLGSLSVNAISLDDGSFAYAFTGNGVTIGAGGLTASTSSSTSGGSPSFGLPIALGASQTWSVMNNQVTVADGMSGPSSQWTVDTSNGGQIEVRSDVEVGTVALDGSIILDGDAVDPQGSINATDGHDVNLSGGARLESASGGGTSKVGPLSTVASFVYIGDGGGDAGTLHVAGAATFDSGSSLAAALAGPGTTAGTDYSQLSATGPVTLGGAGLNLYGNRSNGSGGADCLVLTPGQVLTVVTGSSVSGTFANLAQGSTDTIGCAGGAGTAPTVRINYLANSVTATVLTAGSSTATTTTTTNSTNTTTTTTTSTSPTKRSSATEVSCDLSEQTQDFQCTATVADASAIEPAGTPSGTVTFTINAGGGGGFPLTSACNLAPSSSGPTAFCAVQYNPPPGGIPPGEQPDITANYAGDASFNPSSGMPADEFDSSATETDTSSASTSTNTTTQATTASATSSTMTETASVPTTTTTSTSTASTATQCLLHPATNTVIERRARVVIGVTAQDIGPMVGITGSLLDLCQHPYTAGDKALATAALQLETSARSIFAPASVTSLTSALGSSPHSLSASATAALITGLALQGPAKDAYTTLAQTIIHDPPDPAWRTIAVPPRTWPGRLPKSSGLSGAQQRLLHAYLAATLHGTADDICVATAINRASTAVHDGDRAIAAQQYAAGATCATAAQALDLTIARQLPTVGVLLRRLITRALTPVVLRATNAHAKQLELRRRAAAHQLATIKRLIALPAATVAQLRAADLLAPKGHATLSATLKSLPTPALYTSLATVAAQSAQALGAAA